MLTTQEIRSVQHEQTRLDLYYSYPKDHSQKRPAVLIFPAWTGRDHLVDHKANLMSSKGYVGIAVDLYGEGKVGKTRDECAQLMMPFAENRQFLKTRIAKIIDHIKHDPLIDSQKILVIGYCFGGMCALDTIRNNLGVCAGISIHGLYSKPGYTLPDAYDAKVLVIHGHKDPMISQTDVTAFQQELQAAKVDWQMMFYGTGYHAFTNPEANDPDFGTVFDATLDDRTNHYVDVFLKEILE